LDVRQLQHLVEIIRMRHRRRSLLSTIALYAICVWCVLSVFCNNSIAQVHTHTPTQPFYGSVDFVRDNPVEPVPEETFTHSHSSWSSNVPICTSNVLKMLQALTVFNLNLHDGLTVTLLYC